MSETTQRKAPRVRLRSNLQKVLAAITHVIAVAEKQQVPVTQYDILKTLFIADKSHLNEYGRPITFDNYYAMRAGPVPSLAYDLLKENKRVLKDRNIAFLPWDRTRGHGGRYYYSKPNIGKFDGVLSDSDTLALSNALSVIQSLTFGQIRALTHNDPAYIEAWGDGGTDRSWMSYGMLFDAPDFEKAETVEFLSKHT